MKPAKFRYARHVNVDTGEIIEVLPDHIIEQPRLWNKFDDNRFMNAANEEDLDEVLVVDQSCDEVFIVSRSDAFDNNLFPAEYPTEDIQIADIRKGRIRIPHSDKAVTKSLFPAEKSRVMVLLRGETFNCDWDPKIGTDSEHAGVLNIGWRLKGLVNPGEHLKVSKTHTGEYVIQ